MRGNLIKIRSCTTFKWFNWFDGLCIELFKFYEEEEKEKQKKKNKNKNKKRKRKRNEALKLYFFISSLFLFVVYTSRH